MSKMKIIYSQQMAATILGPPHYPKMKTVFIGRGMICEPFDLDPEGLKKGYSATYELREFKIYDKDGQEVGMDAMHLAGLLAKFADAVGREFLSGIERDWLEKGRPTNGDTPPAPAPDLRRLARDLIWNTCRQREKVPGVLVPLVDDLYPELDEETRAGIRKEFSERIARS